MASRLDTADMNQSLHERFGALTGVAVAAAMAALWLGGTRLALDHDDNASRSAAMALSGLLFVRAMMLAPLTLRISALRGWHAGVAAGSGLIAPAWPVIVLAWSASVVPLTQVLAAELLLVIASVVLPAIGVGLGRVVRQTARAVAASTALGLAIAGFVWFFRHGWGGA
jgi:hypothetical protein